jgi:high-affinity iron transporter
MVAVLTFVLQQRLPYRKMLITTGILLGVVLLVMVGEQAQEMQLAHWISTTPISRLENIIPAWMGLWFALFPTVETLVAQLIAAVLVIGSYYAARHFGGALPQSTEPVQEARAEADAAIVESLESPVKAGETEPSSLKAARPLADEMDSRQRGGRIVATGRI